MSIVLPPLPFSVDELEPYISRSTVDLHYSKHHAGYVSRTNKLLADSQLADLDADEIVRAARAADNTALFNNAAQAWNHTFYWNSLRPGGGGPPYGVVSTLIKKDFGGFEDFRARLHSVATGHFGSGWAWVVLNGGHLEVTHTSDADNPLVHDHIPVLGIDVWEHAYYLDYQNRRTDYVTEVLENLLNWDFANQNLVSDSRAESVDQISRRPVNARSSVTSRV